MKKEKNYEEENKFYHSLASLFRELAKREIEEERKKEARK